MKVVYKWILKAVKKCIKDNQLDRHIKILCGKKKTMITSKTHSGYSTSGVNLYVLYLIFLLLAINYVETANYKNVEEGKPTDIECGKIKIKYVDSVTPTKDQRRNLKSLPRFTVNDHGTLHINETKKIDNGFYTCESTTKNNAQSSINVVKIYLKRGI